MSFTWRQIVEHSNYGPVGLPLIDVYISDDGWAAGHRWADAVAASAALMAGALALAPWEFRPKKLITIHQRVVR